MDELFDDLFKQMEFFRHIKHTHAKETEPYIEAKERAIEALNDYIDQRIEQALPKKFYHG